MNATEARQRIVDVLNELKRDGWAIGGHWDDDNLVICSRGDEGFLVDVYALDQ